ncbi:MAG: hypothetical protein NVS9B3_03380 [Gemmatimonadaceae bacterium]
MTSFGIGATPQPELIRLLLARGDSVTRRAEAVASMGAERLSAPAVGGGWSYALMQPRRLPAPRFIRVNFGDACALMVVHAERHLGQIERALSAT